MFLISEIVLKKKKRLARSRQTNIEKTVEAFLFLFDSAISTSIRSYQEKFEMNEYLWKMGILNISWCLSQSSAA